jgi:hypothetical protein
VNEVHGDSFERNTIFIIKRHRALWLDHLEDRPCSRYANRISICRGNAYQICGYALRQGGVERQASCQREIARRTVLELKFQGSANQTTWILAFAGG